jgi:Tfp pilus assembly protein FimV
MRSGIVNLRLAAAAVLPILLSVGEAGAVGLGKMTVFSHLGSRFEAEVQLLDATADKRPLAECFHLDQKGETDVPMLTRGRLTVVQQTAGLRLRIVSEQTIHEPLLQVKLRVGCGSEMVRNYLLLIDPPPEQTLPPPAGAAGRRWTIGRVFRARPQPGAGHSTDRSRYRPGTACALVRRHADSGSTGRCGKAVGPESRACR